MSETSSRRQLDLTEIGYDLEAVADLTGVSATRIRNWTYRSRLVPTEHGGRRGTRRIYSFQSLFKIACVRALVDGVRIPAEDAIEALDPYRSPLGEMLEQRPLRLRRNDAGRWDVVPDGTRRPAAVVIVPEGVYLEMRPRFMERYPAETAEFERKLAELREKQRREQPLLDELAERHRREHADLDERLLSQRSASDEPGERFRRERDAKRELRERHQREEAELRERHQRERGGHD